MPPLPIISGAECVSALARLGYQQVRQKGNQVRLQCAGLARPVLLLAFAVSWFAGCRPDSGAELPAGQITGLCPAASVSTAEGHTCGVSRIGRAFCWGYNGYGQLGDGTLGSRALPGAVIAASDVVSQIATGGYHTCELRTDRTAWCWGANDGGELGDGTFVDAVLPVAVERLGATVDSIAAGVDSTCARKVDGTLWCWGHVLARGIGESDRNGGVPVNVAALGDSVSSVVTGLRYSCAVKVDHTLWCWGENSSGQLGDGSQTTRLLPVPIDALGATVANVWAGWDHTCAATVDGEALCWGSNEYGQIGDGTKLSNPLPQRVNLPDAVATMALGDRHTCAVTTAGQVWCWGSNLRGQLGDNDLAESVLPLRVEQLDRAVASVTAAGFHTCVRDDQGALLCWGDNLDGQLGDGTTGSHRSRPSAVAGCL